MVISKFIMSLRISCFLMVDYESILIYHNKEIDDLSTIQKKEKEEKSCAII